MFYYFCPVLSPKTKLFAPSKFCAYIPVESANLILDVKANAITRPEMNLELYVMLDESDKRFDGQIARLHLTRGLAMVSQKRAENVVLSSLFEKWLEQHSESISVHPKGAVLLSPPDWFGKNTRSRANFAI